MVWHLLPPTNDGYVVDDDDDDYAKQSDNTFKAVCSRIRPLMREFLHTHVTPRLPTRAAFPTNANSRIVTRNIGTEGLGIGGPLLTRRKKNKISSHKSQTFHDNGDGKKMDDATSMNRGGSEHTNVDSTA